MNRTALRLSAVSALLNGGAGPFPTMAGAHVYDSMQDAISDLVDKERVPILVVRTDEDTRQWRGSASAPTPQIARQIKLRIEASVLTARRAQDGEIIVAWPTTDAALEAMLDLLEFQIENALFGSSAWAMWFKSGWTIQSGESFPVWTSPTEGKVRLAIREMTFTVALAADCLPPARGAHQVAQDGSGNPIVPVEIPAPLASILAYIDSHGGGDWKTAVAQIKTSLKTQDLPKSSLHPRLGSVRMFVPEAAAPAGEIPKVLLEAELLDPDI